MYDLVVLGGGSGGLNVATAAARVGAKVALVEKHRLGGECTHTACVPSKALLKAAHLAHEIRTAGAYGLRVGAPQVDFAAVMGRVRQVVASFAGSDSGKSLEAKGIAVFRGAPAFETYDTVRLDDGRRIAGARIVIATGSRPAVPAIPGLKEAGCLDNTSVWDLEELPAALVVLGAGPVGMEFAQAFARFGTKVTVLGRNPRVLPAEDPEVSDRVQAELAGEGITFHLGVEVTGVTARDGQKVVSFRGPADGASSEVACTHLLVGAGRLANVEGLNLEAIGIRADSKQGIPVDDYLQTRARHVYAIGDVLGRRRFTHAAEREAAVAFQNAVLGISKRIDYAALPWATFIDPEVATVGRLDDTAEEVRVFRAAYDDLDRARIDGRTRGFAKLVATPAGKIRGVTIVGDEASTILHEFVLAMEQGLTLADIAAAVHIYPTRSGLARKLANQFVATRLDGGLVQTALRFFYGFRPRTPGDGPPAGAAEGEGQPEPAGHDHE